MRTLAAWSPLACCCGCCGVSCPDGWRELWDESPGPIDPAIWAPLFGDPLVVVGDGTVTNPAGGSFSIRQIASVLAAAGGTLRCDGLTWNGDPGVDGPGFGFYDFGSVGNAVLVGWSSALGAWVVQSVAGITSTGNTGPSLGVVTFQWNASAWSLTIDGPIPFSIADVFPGALGGDFYALVSPLGAVVGDSVIDSVAVNCDALPG